ncbi:aldehyde dehydrogenase family protein [Psychrobacter sanguinis]|uniref:Aldehyde dehydrogenase family protein n=1 Tax=Psychrobacter sanguinis TaxID=861445 RepID=A0A844M2J6_9GAMM|nr:aldehyde dehydrogenase family protein [Psychrobacter sanguinis]MUG33182.1 aldehyde dehydrogenase family protein [Psychrobacter sanguinis]
MEMTKQDFLAVLNNEIKLNHAFIDGLWCDIESDMEHSLIDPSIGQVIATTKLCLTKHVDSAANAAKVAFVGWSQTTRQQRADYLNAIASAMSARFDTLVGLSVLNNGKPIEEAKIDVSDAIACYQYYADLISQQPQRTQVTTKEEGVKLYKVLEPVGVCALIVPWNFPMVTTAWKLAPALAAGCTVILKPSEITLIPELVLGDILIEIGLPKGVVNILPGAAEVGTAMTMHPLVDKVSFTGSNAVGEKVMRQASSSIKDISLELGGKSAIIVCEDADINSACDIIIAGIFFNAGQICSATSRLLVHKNIADDLYQILRKKTQELVVGDGFDSDTIMGPLVSEQQLKQVQQYFSIAKQEGLSCLTGGKLMRADVNNLENNKGYFVEPTVYMNVPRSSRLWKEEVFGPVLVTHEFSTDQEAIILANDSKYALAATVVSRNESHAMEMALQIKAGHIWINEIQIVLPEAGWGGFKQSGIGRELGEDGLAAYQLSKHILLTGSE